MRQRVEDFGRLLVMIEDLVSYCEAPCRAKDVDQYYEDLSEIKQVEIEHLIRNLSVIKEKLYECLEICKGEDYLNESDSKKDLP